MIRINNTQYFHFLQQADAMRRSGSLCDAIISVGSQTFRAHRLVLACASSRLAQQLAQGDSDRPVHCTLDLFSPRTFQQVLDFTYTQALEVAADDLRLLLRAAQLLEMQPLEEQCRKQLDALDYRDGDGRRPATGVKEEAKGAEGTDEREKEGSRRDEGARELRQASGSPVGENHAPSSPAKSHDGSPLPRKKPRPPPTASSYSRDSVITRPAGSSSSFTSSQAFSTNMLNSISTLRQIAKNYSNLLTGHHLQSPNQPYPLSFSSPHVFPLLRPHVPTLGPHSMVGYPGLYSHYSQNLYAGSIGVGDILKQSSLKRKRPSQREFTRAVQSHEPSYAEAPKAGAHRVKACHNCNADVLGDPALRESSATPSGCRFCGRGDKNEPHSHRHNHRGEKPYQCQHCPKKFSLKHQLDTHHRVHTGEKPFECRLCGQRSRDYSAMIKHLRTHGGAAPYQCTVCLEFCSSLVAMQRHLKSHTVQEFPPDWSINSTYLYTSHI
ncbi:zinc finger and BTB domain-containing protein 16 [Betta splendens]|uniref:Zinc finger and BTB domain-containing protein 16 n=1 Tax=Betta splendens TaxID=158456 RepID=A0A6P7KT35_BETSP|nr:zinc finger and BTB domain-containing protein 16 [Betta splendens]